MARVSKKYAPPGRMKPEPPPEVIEEAPPAQEASPAQEADAATNGHRPPAALAMPEAAEMRRAIADNVWLHFTQMGEFAEGGRLERPTVIVRGEGSHIWDSDGNEYIDGLAGLFCV
ncbi:MAG TPA: hypothetical protein VIC60_05330, partial [Thermomicrobiales bacterium]